jgi:hypothetical protein
MKVSGKVNTAGLLPIALAIVATILFGFWYRQQAVYQMQQRFRTGHIPEVTIEMAGGSSGAFPGTAVESGAYMLFRIYDEGFPRTKMARRRAAVQFSATDEEARPWRIEQAYVGNSFVAYVPFGYSKRPKKLTLQATARGRLLGRWPVPELTSPRRVLVASGADKADVTVRWKEGKASALTRQLEVKLASPLASDETWLCRVVGLTYGKVVRPGRVTLPPGSSTGVVEVEVVNGSEGLDLCEMTITRFRSYDIKKVVELGKASIVNSGTEPSLVVVPDVVQVSPELTLTFRPQDVESGAGRHNRNLGLLVSTKDMVQSFEAKLLGSEPAEHGVSIDLQGRFPIGTKVTIANTPPFLGSGSYSPGRMPLRLEVRATPYRKVGELTRTFRIGEAR